MILNTQLFNLEIFKTNTNLQEALFYEVAKEAQGRYNFDAIVLLPILANIFAESGYIYDAEEKVVEDTAQRYLDIKSLGNVDLEDAAKFVGRGYIQLTGRLNYTFMRIHFGVAFDTEPDLALQRVYSAAIAANFCVPKFANFGQTPDKITPEQIKEGRRVVNGGYNGLNNYVNELQRLVEEANMENRFEPFMSLLNEVE